MKPQLQIQIPEPCHQPWQDMTLITQNTRHCKSCDKVITDFTEMSDEELIHYLSTHKNVCGRFMQSQLNRKLSDAGFPKSRRGIWALLILPAFLSTSALRAKSTQNTNNEPIAFQFINYSSRATQRIVTVTGNVTEKDSITCVGVNVKAILNADTAEIVTDEWGNYTLQLNVDDNDMITLEFSKAGYALSYEKLVVLPDIDTYSLHTDIQKISLANPDISNLPWVGGAIVSTEAVPMSNFRFFLHRITHPFRKLRRKP